MYNLELIFQTAHRELKPRTPVPEIRAQLFPFASLNHTARLQHGRLTIRISDIFVDAPSDVYRSLALILLAKLYREKVDSKHHRTYRLFILRVDIQERVREVRHTRGRGARLVGSRGLHVDLDVTFNRLNEAHFGGLLQKPSLSWSARRSQHTLGRYDSTHHAIFISRVFDSCTVPSYVLDYVMFHEMLHVKHPTRVQDSHVIAHTREFKMEERTFPRYREAKLWLRSI